MLSNIDKNSLQVKLFFIAIAIYAILGQPTPDKLGLIEIIIASFLILSIGIGNFVSSITLQPIFDKNKSDFEKIASASLCFLLVVPTVIGLFNGNNLESIFRDLIPLIYSFIPLFLYHKLSKTDVYNLYHVCMYAGVILALRFLHISGFSWELLGNHEFYDNNMYLAISPFILFATLFLFLDFFEVKSLLMKVLMISYSVVCAGAILATSQRATAGLGVLFALLYIFKKSKENVKYLLIAGLSILGIYFCFHEYIITSYNMLIEKTISVGTNSRTAEFSEVVNEIKGSWFTTLFGHGWGYKFISPAVGEKVGFTHCMFSYFLLKTGFIGMVVYISYLASIVFKVFHRNKNFIFYACLPPLIIAMTLYTGYKYFDFGCLLLILLTVNRIPLTLSAKREDVINQLKEENIDNPVLDSGILIQKALGISKTEMFINAYKVLSTRQSHRINILVRKRLRNKPIARIEGYKEFWGMNFKLNKDTLVPRPDSETVVEAILENFDKEDELKILDLGTGSGCLLISVLSEFPNATGIGVDLSINAIKQAKENAKNLGFDNRVKFIKSNWFENVKGEFDIIISNPPYVKRTEKLSKEVMNYDPHLALFAEDDGLKCYEDISKEICNYLSPNGKVFFEIGVGQKEKVSCFMKKNGLKFVSYKKDLKGKIRCILFEKETK